MTPFKFGKKKKDKNGSVDLSSPSSQYTSTVSGIQGESPQTSQYSNSSYSNSNSNSRPFYSPNKQPQTSPGVVINSTFSGITPQSNSHQFQSNSNQQYSNQSLRYDQNNNIHNPRSPQRGQPRQYQQQPPPPPPPPQQQQQFNQQRYQPHQQQPAPPQHNAHLVPSPWARSKLLISPFPRYRHAASSLANDRGEVLVMGGLHNTSVYGDTWIIKPEADGKSFQTFQVDIYEDSPAPRVGHASTLCGNAYVIFGGDTVTNDAGEIDNDLYLFNMNSHTWTIPHPVGRKPAGRYGHAIGVIAVTNFDSKLYLYGGQLDDEIYSDLVMFNLSSFRRPDVQWEWVIPEDSIQPPGLTNHTMDVYDNKLWIFGGSTGKRLSNELWMFDPSINKWDLVETLGSTPAPVEEHASVVYNDLLIIHGGKNNQGEAVSDVHILNLITKTWFKLPSALPLEPQGKYGHSLSVMKNGQILILGGHLPDFARLGDDLEPSLDDNGVGTVLHTLSLANITKLIPGLHQYSTPSHVNQDRFQSNVPSGSNILTPPGAQAQRTPTAQTSGASPENSLSSNAKRSLSSASSLSKNVQQLKNSSSENVSRKESFNGQTKTPQKPQGGHDSTPIVTPLAKTPVRQPHQLERAADIYSSPEEELPLQIPSPIRSGDKKLYNPDTVVEGYSKDSKADIEADQNEVFRTPSITTPLDEDEIDEPVSESSPATLATSIKKSLLSESYLAGETKSTDFLADYVNESATSLQDKLEKDKQAGDSPTSRSVSDNTTGKDSVEISADADLHSEINGTDYPHQGSVSTRQGSVISNNADFGVGAAAAVGTGLKNVFVGKGNTISEIQPATSKEIPGSFPTTETPNSIQPFSHTITSPQIKDTDERQQFKIIIDSLSAELEDLKVSTTNQIRTASSKVKLLEEENFNLKAKLEAINEAPKVDESEIKRKHIKLNTDYQVLYNDHQSLKAKFEEIAPLFSENLINLSELNNVIKQQQSELEKKSLKLSQQEDWKRKYDELKLQHDSLLEKHEETVKSRSLTGGNNTSTEKLTQSIDAFLSQYTSKDLETGKVTTKDLSTISNAADSETVTEALRAQIDELLKENEVAHANNKELTSQIKELKAATADIGVLKAKVSELSKIEENYKDSLHSVKNSSRALQISQSELAKQKEISTKLQEEIDELKIFKAKKSSRGASRNATPILNSYTNKGSEDEGEEDFENAHYNLKLRDLQAELFIITQERDELKHDVLALKKKLLVASTPNSSL